MPLGKLGQSTAKHLDKDSAMDKETSSTVNEVLIDTI